MGSGKRWRIQLQGLAFRRRNNIILQDIDAAFQTGETTLLTGHNGSGKSTLMRILAGLLRPDRGHFHLDQAAPEEWRHCRHLLLRDICYLHQQPYLFDCSVFDNVAYGLRRRGVPPHIIHDRVRQALQAMSLEQLEKRPSHALSGGERQRVAIARAWVLAPRLMLLDEPVANMDKPARRQTIQLINLLRENGIGVLVTSHDPQHGELQIDHHLHLYQGRLETKTL